MKRRAFVRSAIAAAAVHPRSFDRLYRIVIQDPGDVAAVRGDGRKVTLKGAAIKELASGLKGHVLLARDQGYDVARRILNPSFDKRPALIVQPSSDEEVRRAVAFANENSLLVAVKCGGHSFSGQSTCDDGMMLDLSAGLRGVTADPKARRAVVKGGTLLGQVDRELAALGLVTPLGTVSHTGTGGLTTGGGFGRLARRFGLALDNVTAVDVVTADGQLRHADRDQNPDLFWGVRGGGGNFGVVTSFEFQLHPMQGQVIGGNKVFPFSKARDVLAFYADYSPGAPDELYLDLIVQQLPGSDPVVVLHACYSGAPSGAAKAFDPIRKLGTPLADEIKPVDYVALQRSTDISDPRAMGMYLKSGFPRAISAELITEILKGFPARPDRMTELLFQHAGGAISRVPTAATAFAHRYAQHNMICVVGWPAASSSAEPMAWARQYWKTLEPFTQGFYTNEVEADHTAAAVNANFRENYPRLAAVKAKYDPGNLFRLNANVRPGA